MHLQNKNKIVNRVILVRLLMSSYRHEYSWRIEPLFPYCPILQLIESMHCIEPRRACSSLLQNHVLSLVLL